MFSLGDWQDLIYKIRLKAAPALAKRFSWNANERVAGKWAATSLPPTDWWALPQIKKRWNALISNNTNQDYADYLVEKYWPEAQGLVALSPGCGVGSHEIKFARHSCFEKIEAFDLSPQAVGAAQLKAQNAGLKNLHYFTANLYEFDFPAQKYDLVLFHSSLHHFKNLDNLAQKIAKALKPNGLLVIHEYVGPRRLQWTPEQLKEINRQLVNELPPAFRLRYGTNDPKPLVRRPSVLRMLLSDPSEAVESDQILPALHQYFEVVEEKPLRGAILHLLLKDIAHHFLNPTPESEAVLQRLFQLEDDWTAQTGVSDFLFGVYRAKSISKNS